MPDHSFEEIHDTVIDLLAGKETSSGYNLEQFEGLKIAVWGVFERRAGRQLVGNSTLGRVDTELLREVFWELFRQGIIVPGLDSANPMFPWFRVTSEGRKILTQQPHFPRDVEAYTRLLKQSVPNLNDVTLVYLGEAMSAFRADCMLASSVMLGVAAEHTFLLLIQSVLGNTKWRQRYEPVDRERTILKKFTKFRGLLDTDLKQLPADLKEDLDTQFAGILSVIRTTRNESGHPTGKLLEREQVYVLLQLFVAYCKKMYALRAYFESP